MSNKTLNLEFSPDYKTKHLLVRDDIAKFFVASASRQNPTAKVLEFYLLKCPDFVKAYSEYARKQLEKESD